MTWKEWEKVSMPPDEQTEEADLPYLWYSEDEWNKIMFHIRSQVEAILRPLRTYGQGIFVDGAVKELMLLFDLMSQRVRGKDIPLIVVAAPKPSPME